MPTTAELSRNTLHIIQAKMAEWPEVQFTLEKHFEADQRVYLQYANTIYASIAAFSSYCYALET